MSDDIKDDLYQDNTNNSNIENQESLASTNKVDSNFLANEKNAAQIATKVDFRNYVDYTFSGTAEESFNHPLGRSPLIVNISGQSKAAQIHVNIFKSTKTKLFATSTVAGTKARFILA